MNKTVFISSFHPFISRNILATELLARLTGQGIRVVLLVPEKKKNFFDEEFGSWREKGVAIESFDTSLLWQDRFLNYLALAALSTRTLWLKRRTEMKGSGTFATYLLANPLGQLLTRALSRLLTPSETYAEAFKRYVPDAVFMTDINSLFDVRLYYDAHARSIPVLGMVRSWDNLTAKGLMRVIPELLAVHSDTEKREARTLHGVKEERIRVIGIPHYDRYVTGERMSRERFFDGLGISHHKRLVLFTPTGDRYLSQNTIDKEITDLLDTELPEDCHLLVRLPPTDKVASLENYQGRRVTIERPSTRFKTFKNIELAPGDEEHLADTLQWSDLVVTGPSTICIDAAFFNKPVILIGFDGKHERPYLSGLRRYYDYDHWKPILESGGVWFAETQEDFKKALDAYLKDASLHQSGRERIVKDEAYNRDGKSAERLVQVLMELIP